MIDLTVFSRNITPGRLTGTKLLFIILSLAFFHIFFLFLFRHLQITKQLQKNSNYHKVMCKNHQQNIPSCKKTY